MIDLSATRAVLADRLARSGRAAFGAGEAADLLAMDPKTLRRLGDRGQIMFIRKGRARRAYLIEHLIAFLAAGGVPKDWREDAGGCRPTGGRESANILMISASAAGGFLDPQGRRPSARPRPTSAT